MDECWNHSRVHNDRTQIENVQFLLRAAETRIIVREICSWIASHITYDVDAWQRTKSACTNDDLGNTGATTGSSSGKGVSNRLNSDNISHTNNTGFWDRLLLNVESDDKEGCDRPGYQAVKTGRAVCTGYCDLFTLLCRLVTL